MRIGFASFLKNQFFVLRTRFFYLFIREFDRRPELARAIREARGNDVALREAEDTK